MKSLEEIRELALSSPVFENPEVSFLAEGFGNYNYLIEERGKKFVLRVKKSHENQFSDSLEKEYVFLSYFKKSGIDFCPEVLFYDSKRCFLVETFLEGNKVSQADFTVKQIDQFAAQLYKLFRVSVSGFEKYSKENSLKKFHHLSPAESLELYGFKRFEDVDVSVVGTEIYDWIKTELSNNSEYVQTLELSGPKLGFSWGDIQSEVIVDSAAELAPETSVA